MYNSESVGQRLRELRESVGITQKEMAIKRGVSQSAIAKQESGVNAIGDEGILWYADFYNISTDYLLGRTDIPNSHTDAVSTPAAIRNVTEAEMIASVKTAYKNIVGYEASQAARPQDDYVPVVMAARSDDDTPPRVVRVKRGVDLPDGAEEAERRGI